MSNPIRRRLPVLLRVVEINSRKAPASRAQSLSEAPSFHRDKLSLESLHLSDALDEPEGVQRDLVRIFVAELVVRSESGAYLVFGLLLRPTLRPFDLASHFSKERRRAPVSAPMCLRRERAPCFGQSLKRTCGWCVPSGSPLLVNSFSRREASSLMLLRLASQPRPNKKRNTARLLSIQPRRRSLPLTRTNPCASRRAGLFNPRPRSRPVRRTQPHTGLLEQPGCEVWCRTRRCATSSAAPQRRRKKCKRGGRELRAFQCRPRRARGRPSAAAAAALPRTELTSSERSPRA